MATACCLFAAELQIRAKHPCGMHAHACTEVVFYLRGEGCLKQGGASLPYAPGRVSVYQATQQHADLPTTDGIQLCVGVTGCSADKLTPGMWQTDPELAACAERIRREVPAAQKPGAQDRLDILAGWLVLELRRVTGGMVRTDGLPYHVSAAKEILDSRFNEDIDLQELAGRLFISPDYLRHIFKQSLGESPLNYLIRRRLDSACELLNRTDLPVGEVGQRVGLDNAYYFSRIFHRRLGLTPSAYRQQTRRQGVRGGAGGGAP